MYPGNALGYIRVHSQTSRTIALCDSNVAPIAGCSFTLKCARPATAMTDQGLIRTPWAGGK